jgi:hypothetical protein
LSCRLLAFAATDLDLACRLLAAAAATCH